MLFMPCTRNKFLEVKKNCFLSLSSPHLDVLDHAEIGLVPIGIVIYSSEF